jgi:PKD repeat protein
VVVSASSTTPVASFTTNPKSGQVPLNVTFTNTSSGTITNAFWSFGDGTESNTISSRVIHTYNSAGSFSVSLTVSGPGGSDILRRPNHVLVTNTTMSTVTIKASDNTASEPGTDVGKFRFIRNGGLNAALTVNYTVSGTATPGIDYSNLSGSVTFAAGKTNEFLTVQPLDDALAESTETVVLTLSTNDAYKVGSPNSATVNINDNDQALPIVTITASDATASEPGSNTGKFTVTRTGSTNALLTVNYTVSGTATAGTDYSALSGHATIAAGKFSKTIAVTPKDDTLRETTETVKVTLSPSTTYNIGSSSNATVNILDND